MAGSEHLSKRWRALTPVQKAMLRRLGRDGALSPRGGFEMLTVRSLAARGFLRRDRLGKSSDGVGRWILTALGERMLPEPAGETEPFVGTGWLDGHGPG